MFKTFKDIKGVHLFGVEIFENDMNTYGICTGLTKGDSLPKGAFPLGGVEPVRCAKDLGSF